MSLLSSNQSIGGAFDDRPCVTLLKIQVASNRLWLYSIDCKEIICIFECFIRKPDPFKILVSKV